MMRKVSLSVICALLAAPAISMKLEKPQMGLAAVDSKPKMGLAAMDSNSTPKMTLSVVHGNVHEMTVTEMESIFGRSDEVHKHSLDEIAASMTLPQAMNVLQNASEGNNKQLLQVMDFLNGTTQLRSKASGFGGLDGARDLLNDMIYESLKKYDEEIAKCVDFYAKQCALMEVARGQISAANYQAATSRALILDATANIKRCENDIPSTKQELKDENSQCKEQLHELNKRLKVIMGDIAIMTMILKMSDCDAKLLQMNKLAVMRCENTCTNTEQITFNNKQLQGEVNKLQSSNVQELLAETFSSLYDGDDDGENTESLDNATLDDNNTFAFDSSEMKMVQVAGSDYEELQDTDDSDFLDEEGKPKKCQCKVELYQHGDFKGWKATYGCGVYGLMKGNKGFTAKGAKNDDASAIKVFGKGCKAQLFKHGDFKGWKATYTVGEYPYQQFIGHGAKNDDASAIKVGMVKKKKPPVKFKRPPVPKTKVPRNPCTDPNQGAPGKGIKGKCTLKKSPRCYKIQGRFLQIQAGIEDQRDELLDQISSLEQSCKEMRESLEASIENDNALLSASQTKLAAATEKEAAAGETGRQVAKENTQYHKDLLKQMKTCSANYVDYETELCALKKIRGDLFKKMKKGHTGFFQDCEVSKWVPETCTKKCAGGEQKLTRNVLKHPGGKNAKGAKCLPLAAKKKCNRGPCPIDCVVAKWTGWSKCSAKCGGGVMQRVRDVKVAMRYAGKPCSSTTETKSCNVKACSKNCVLRRWTKWTGCSKDCDGGTKKRVRIVKEPAEGSGSCASPWDKTRLQYKPCAQKGCRVPNPKKVMKCQKSLDILLMVDGTPKSGKKGWAAEVKAINLFVDAFGGKGVVSKPNFAVVQYTGPRTWSGVSKCTGKSKKKVDQEKVCKVKIAQHFDTSIKKTKATVNALQFTPGAKLLSLGLMTAISEFPLGRKKSPTVVVVFMDGEPLSYRKTGLAATTLRKSARLVFVIINKFSPLKSIKKWASRRWQENIIITKSPKELAEAATGTHVVANICPKRGSPKLKMPRKKKGGKR